MDESEHAAIWARLCEEADAYVVRYWSRAFEQCSCHDTKSHDWRRCLEEAGLYLWKGHGGRSPMTALIVAWWSQHVGAWQARKAIRLWQREVAEM